MLAKKSEIGGERAHNSKREDVVDKADSDLALENRWSVWSLDIKDAFLQVPQKRPVHCKIPRVLEEKEVKQHMEWRPMLATWSCPSQTTRC